VIHDVDLGELFGGGETHADTVLKRAALDNPGPQSPVCLPFVGIKRRHSRCLMIGDPMRRCALEMKEKLNNEDQ